MGCAITVSSCGASAVFLYRNRVSKNPRCFGRLSKSLKNNINMIKYKDIAFTAYAVSDIPKARAFYEGVLGLKTNGEYDGHDNAEYVEYAVGPSTLAIGKSEMWKPSEDGASVALEVENFDEALAELTQKKCASKNGPARLSFMQNGSNSRS